MSPIDWAIQPLKKYATFSGRASRSEFWWYTLAVTIIFVVLWIVLVGSVGGMAAMGSDPGSGMAAAFGGLGMIVLLFGLVIVLPTLAVQVRRLHDSGRSGWWLGGYYILYAVYMIVAMGSVFGAASSGDPSGGSMAGLMVAGALGLALLVYFVVLVVFYALPGTKGANAYGPDPLDGDYSKIFS